MKKNGGVKTKICTDCGAEFVGDGERCPKCEKSRDRYMKKNLKIIEEVLNTDEDIFKSYDFYKIRVRKNEIIFEIVLDSVKYKTYSIEIPEDVTIKGLIKNIIKEIYSTDINPRQKYINSTKSFNNRKIKSMELWSNRENYKKVAQINMDLIQRHQETNKMKNAVKELKSIISELYRTLELLRPQWKHEEIEDRIVNKLEELNISNIKIQREENKIIAVKDTGIVEVKLDEYSDFNSVWLRLNVV